jgi:hypothetical protein
LSGPKSKLQEVGPSSRFRSTKAFRLGKLSLGIDFVDEVVEKFAAGRERALNGVLTSPARMRGDAAAERPLGRGCLFHGVNDQPFELSLTPSSGVAPKTAGDFRLRIFYLVAQARCLLAQTVLRPINHVNTGLLDQ